MSNIKHNIRQIIEDYFDGPVSEAVYDVLVTTPLNGGDWLFEEGDPGDALFFLVRGRLQAWAGEGESARLLGEVLPGDSVGEAGILTGAPRSAGIKAIRDSLLIRLDKEHFETLAVQHPAMLMKLASHVARLMQRNIDGTGAQQRPYGTISIVKLGKSQRIRSNIEQLVSQLAEQQQALVLSEENLTDHGAPTATDDNDSLSEPLKQWLADRESEHALVIYRVEAEDIPWSRFALHQSDLTLWMADAGDTPELTLFEQQIEHYEPSASQQALVLNHAENQPIEGTCHWLDVRPTDFHIHLREGVPEDLKRLHRVITGQAIGLVLGAGAVRGLSELGVYKALVEQGVPIDWVGGSSIGSIVAGAIAHNWTPEHATQVARDAFVKGKPFSDYTLPVVSLIRGKRMVRLLKAEMDVDIEDLPIPYFCVSSRLDRGEVHIHTRGGLVNAIRASAALPGVLPPAVVDSELVVDGAVLNNLPVDVMLKNPVSTIIAVDVSVQHTRQVDYSETPSSMQILRSRLLPFTRRYRVPGLATLILRSTEIGTLLQSRERGALADLLITPPVRQFGMTDVKSFDPIVEVGYQHATDVIGEWLSAQAAPANRQGKDSPA